MKRNRQFDELVKNIPPDILKNVEKSMTCAYLVNGDRCNIGSRCYPERCEKRKLHKDFENDTV